MVLFDYLLNHINKFIIVTFTTKFFKFLILLELFDSAIDILFRAFIWSSNYFQMWRMRCKLRIFELKHW